MTTTSRKAKDLAYDRLKELDTSTDNSKKNMDHTPNQKQTKRRRDSGDDADDWLSSQQPYRKKTLVHDPTMPSTSDDKRDRRPVGRPRKHRRGIRHQSLPSSLQKQRRTRSRAHHEDDDSDGQMAYFGERYRASEDRGEAIQEAEPNEDDAYVRDENGCMFHTRYGLLLGTLSANKEWTEDSEHPDKRQRKYYPTVHFLEDNVFLHVVGGQADRESLETWKEKMKETNDKSMLIRSFPIVAHILETETGEDTWYPVANIEVWSHHELNQVRINWPIEDLNEEEAKMHQENEEMETAREFMEMDTVVAKNWEMENVKRKKEELEQRVEDQAKEIEELKRQLTCEQEDKRQLADEQQDHKKQLSDLRKRSRKFLAEKQEKFDKEIAEESKKNKKMKKKNDEVLKMRDEYLERTKVLEREKKNLEDRVTSLEMDKESLGGQLSMVRGELTERYELVVDDLKKKLGEATNQAGQLVVKMLQTTVSQITASTAVPPTLENRLFPNGPSFFRPTDPGPAPAPAPIPEDINPLNLLFGPIPVAPDRAPNRARNRARVPIIPKIEPVD